MDNSGIKVMVRAYPSQEERHEANPEKGDLIIETNNQGDLDQAILDPKLRKGKWLAYFKKGKGKHKPLKNYEEALRLIGGTLPVGLL